MHVNIYLYKYKRLSRYKLIIWYANYIVICIYSNNFITFIHNLWWGIILLNMSVRNARGVSTLGHFLYSSGF